MPGTTGLIDITEIVGNNSQLGSQNFATAFGAIIAVALGILVGTMVVTAAAITHQHMGRPIFQRG